MYQPFLVCSMRDLRLSCPVLHRFFTVSEEAKTGILNVQIYILSLFKAQEVYFSGNKRINGAPMKPSKLFYFKETRRYYLFLAAGIKISQRANATAIRVLCK